MAHHDHVDVDPWVNEQLMSLAPEAGWQPEAAARLGDAYARRTANRARHLRWAGAGLAAAVVFVSVPVTRAFGARCVEACVNATTRVTQLWRADEPAAANPPVIGADLGDIAPDLLGSDAAGRSITLSLHRGHVVVANFWATWCGPCKQEIPILNDLNARFGAQGLDVIGVSLDEAGWPAVTPFAADQRIDYPVVLGTDAVAVSFGGVTALPATFLIDQEGRIIAKFEGPLREGLYDVTIIKLLGRQVKR